jgi:hypothetical protein
MRHEDCVTNKTKGKTTMGRIPPLHVLGALLALSGMGTMFRAPHPGSMKSSRKADRAFMKRMQKRRAKKKRR